MLKMNAAVTTQASAIWGQAVWPCPIFQGLPDASLNPQNTGPLRNPLPATQNCPFPQQLSSGALGRGDLRVEMPSHETPGE